jgi:dihydropteroate synthase
VAALTAALGACQVWAHRTGTLDLSTPVIMGVLNTTPDSFSDGGRFIDPAAALDRAEELVSEGAAIIDVGGESTRPGADFVNEEEELARVLPVVRLLRSRLPVPLSIDTRRASVARACLDAGGDIVNDISALSDPEMAEVVAAAGAGLVLMHMQGEPRDMQVNPTYGDVVREVCDSLEEKLGAAVGWGIGREKIALDPGIGFGKTADHNLQLIANLDVLASVGQPVLLGVSRKSFLGKLIGGARPEDRAVATAAACVAGLFKGARIFRVHDVRVVREALQIAEAVRSAGAVEG